MALKYIIYKKYILYKNIYSEILPCILTGKYEGKYKTFEFKK